MAKNLVIVESPAKAKTIEGYLGKDYQVKSSFGHVRDLSSKGLGIDVTNNFKPEYEISTDKKNVISELKKAVKDAEVVWLATDEDREGEAISWHLFETLNLEKKETKRITFNEITKNAITKAIENPREINKQLVDAQQARRVLDRLVGFELSPVLWKKVKPGLSAGRVQSVAVKLIVERENEISKFKSNSFYKIQAQFKKNENEFKAELHKNFENKNDVFDFLERCKGKTFKVHDVQQKPATRTPSAPFTTSTLQQEASLKLGFSVSRTMLVAQHLYEQGKITYMRTDSVNLSETAIENAKSTIEKFYGKEYSKPSKYQTKSSNAQEAHESIRPTNFSVSSVEGTQDEQKLYDLIWKRAIASQMSHAQLERTTVKIGSDNLQEHFTAKGEVIKFDGFLKVYLESSIDDDDDEQNENSLLPLLIEGDVLTNNNIKASQRFTRPLPRYVEASLVKKLEELGIGRPSTYAPTISTIQKRGYVEKIEKEGEERQYTVIEMTKDKIIESNKKEIIGKEKNKLFPTDIGILVTEFLQDNFIGIMDYHFTASVEEQFDEIARGLTDWTKMINEFYSPFHKNVEETIELSGKVTGERVLGVHPVSGKKVIARIGRFGPMIQIGNEKEDGEKPIFASLNKNQSINTIELDEALELFKLPRLIGSYENIDVKANNGRFGPYIQHGKLFVSLKKDDNPMTIDIERAIELINQKREDDKNKIIKIFPDRNDVQLLNGRFGAYLKIGKNNFKLPKNIKVEDLTLQECLDISEKQENTKSKKKTKK